MPSSLLSLLTPYSRIFTRSYIVAVIIIVSPLLLVLASIVGERKEVEKKKRTRRRGVGEKRMAMNTEKERKRKITKNDEEKWKKRTPSSSREQLVAVSLLHNITIRRKRICWEFLCVSYVFIVAAASQQKISRNVCCVRGNRVKKKNSETRKKNRKNNCVVGECTYVVYIICLLRLSSICTFMYLILYIVVIA